MSGVSGESSQRSQRRLSWHDRRLLRLRREILARIDEPVALEAVLLVVELPVASARAQQLVVRPALDDLAVLYTNYTHVATLEDAGIARIADLRGRVVSTGSPGSGTETIAFRVLEAAGIDPQRDMRRQGLGVGPSVDAIKDGKIDAFFWSGGLPTAAILDLASTPGRTLKLLPNDDILPALQRQYGASLYYEVTVPKGAYSGLDADVPVVGVSNLLVVDERMSEALAYDITKALFDHQPDLVAIHREARHLTPASAIVGSPVPFHRGAIRFYRERGVWRE